MNHLNSKDGRGRSILRLLAVAAALLPCVAHAAAPSKKPNIVFILCDDLAIEGLGCYGGESYKTPNLDKLCKEGMRFNHAYANPLCSPTRVALMTGQYDYRSYHGWGVFNPAKHITFGNVLRDAGYVTNLAGKWQFDNFQKHPNHISDSGFSEYMAWTWQLDGKSTLRYWNPSLWSNGKLVPDTQGKYGPDLTGDFELDFVRRHKDQPFLLYYPLILVHAPFEAPPGEDGKPSSTAGGKKAKKKEAKAEDGSSEGKSSLPKSDKNFPAMVAYMDKMVGNLIATLDEAGVRDNTLIVYTGDNGTPRGIVSKMNGHDVLGGKGTMKETGSHVALLANWPGVVPAGSTCDDLVDITDYFATFAEVAGAHVPTDRPIDSHSFAPQLRGERGNPREWGLVELFDKRFAFTKTHKLDQHGDLFDISRSPFIEPLISPAHDTPESKAARDLLAKALATMPKAEKHPGDGPSKGEHEEQ
jgi:arylsulfatase A-like enzyme